MSAMQAAEESHLCGRHRLVCGCGDDLRREGVPGDEWGYRSEATGRQWEMGPLPAALADGWEALAERDIETYSRLSAFEGLRIFLRTMHYHRPIPCGCEVPVPECHQWPMQWTPRGWVCRVTRGRRGDRET